MPVIAGVLSVSVPLAAKQRAGVDDRHRGSDRAAAAGAAGVVNDVRVDDAAELIQHADAGVADVEAVRDVEAATGAFDIDVADGGATC